MQDPKQEAIDHRLMVRDRLAERETLLSEQVAGFRYRKVIHPDGTEDNLNEVLTAEQIRKLIGCDVLSTVVLADRVHVMFMDDLFEDTRPNQKATDLYLERCKPGTQNVTIRGIVVVVPEEDFGGPL